MLCILSAMTPNDILSAIDTEISRLTQARVLLSDLNGSQLFKPSKPKRKKYKMSAEGRKRIVEALRKRWAAKRKAAK